MSNSKIKIGVIGSGKRIRGVLKNTLAAEPGRFEITALYDPYAEQTQKAREEIAPEARIFDTVDELLEQGDVDWVAIGSWNCFHAEQAIAALNKGKNIFCEKPLATNFEDCERLQQAMAKAPGQVFFFGLVLRYTPIYQKIRSILKSGEIGEVISFEFNETLDFNHGGFIHGNWRRNRKYAGTHLLEKCCHDIDIANWLMESLPTKVASFGGKTFFKPENRHLADAIGNNAEGKPAYQIWFDPNPVDPFSEGADIVDNQVAILQYANGVCATFHTNCNAALPERRIYILGSKGTIRADATTAVVEVRKIGFDTPVQVFRPGPAGGHFGGDEVMAKAFAQSITANAEPLATLEDGIRSAVVCFGIDQALDSGQMVDLIPYWQKVGIKP